MLDQETLHPLWVETLMANSKNLKIGYLRILLDSGESMLVGEYASFKWCIEISKDHHVTLMIAMF